MLVSYRFEKALYIYKNYLYMLCAWSNQKVIAYYTLNTWVYKSKSQKIIYIAEYAAMLIKYRLTKSLTTQD